MLVWTSTASRCCGRPSDAPETIPERYRGRTLYRHNPNVTLMRTSAEECRRIGEWIGRKLNACEGDVRFLIPELGVSALDIEGGAFFDPQADAALFKAIETTLVVTGKRRLQRLPLHINDPQFAGAIVAATHGEMQVFDIRGHLLFEREGHDLQ